MFHYTTVDDIPSKKVMYLKYIYFILSIVQIY